MSALREWWHEKLALVMLLIILSPLEPELSGRRRALGAELLGEQEQERI